MSIRSIATINQMETPTAGWRHTTLGDVLDVVRGVTYKKEQASTEAKPGLLPVLRATNIQNGLIFEDLVYVPENCVSETQLLRIGDIVIAASSGSRAVVGKAAQLTTGWRGSFGAFCFGLRPKQGVEPRFLAWFLQTSEYRQRVSRLAAGVNINNLRAKHIEETPVRLPQPSEQQRIVAEIEKQFTRLDASVATLKHVQVNLKHYRAAVLKAAFEGDLVQTEADIAREEARDFEPAGRLLERILAEHRTKWEHQRAERYKPPDSPDVSTLPTLPEGWTWTELGQLAWSVKDGPHYSPKYTTDGIPFITGGNVRPSGVDFTNAKRITPQLHAELCRRCKPEFGDILYTKGGTTGIARVNTYKEEFSVWVHVAVLKLVDSVDHFYVQHALNSPFCYEQAQKFTHGVGNQDLGLTRMIRIAIALPPLAEQSRIVAEVDRRLSFLDELETMVSSNLHRAARLRQSILRRAFSGNL